MCGRACVSGDNGIRAMSSYSSADTLKSFINESDETGIECKAFNEMPLELQCVTLIKSQRETLTNMWIKQFPQGGHRGMIKALAFDSTVQLLSQVSILITQSE